MDFRREADPRDTNLGVVRNMGGVFMGMEVNETSQGVSASGEAKKVD